MSQSTLVMAPQMGWHGSVSARKVAGRMADLARQLRARGHDLKFLAPKQRVLALAKSTDIARIVEHEEPTSIRWLDARSDEDAYYLLWPRDGFQDWVQFAAVAPVSAMRSLAASFGMTAVEASPLCEGGLFARSADRVLVSSALADGAVAGLPRSFRHATLPYPFTSDLYRREQPCESVLTHIDFDCCLVEAPDGGSWLLVGERYHRAYRVHVDFAVERLGLELFVAPQEEVMRKGLNLVVMSSHAVVVPDGCPQIHSFLRSLLGFESVVVVRIDEAFNYNGGHGGLGCMSTVVSAVG